MKNERDRCLKPERKGKAHLSEVARLLAACTADGRDPSCRVPWLKPIVELVIATAMRRGEILALDWQHVHLPESRRVSLSSSLACLRIYIGRTFQRSLQGNVFPVAISGTTRDVVTLLNSRINMGRSMTPLAPRARALTRGEDYRIAWAFLESEGAGA